MKKFWLLSIMLLCLFFCWCWKTEVEETQVSGDEIYTEYINWLVEEQREKLHNITHSGRMHSDYDFNTVIEYLLEKWELDKWELDNNYSEQEIKDIIAASIRDTLERYVEYEFDYIALKEKLKENLPKYTNEIDDYFLLPRKDEYFFRYRWSNNKKSFTCYWYEAAAFMSNGDKYDEWLVKPDKVINSKIEKNNQIFTIKMQDDTLEFYSNLTPWEATIYKLLKNDRRVIVAEDWDKGRTLLENITISKKTWLWVWTKVRVPVYWETPYWIMTYIYCDNAL